MPQAPPSFGSREYWEKRFTSNSNPFEWLEAPTALDPYLVEALQASPDPDPELLHIGCGTSLLSYHLRAHIPNPERIHNLDYSEVAIGVGRKREVDIFQAEPELLQPNKEGHTSAEGAGPESGNTEEQSIKDSQSSAQGAAEPAYMRWSTANLLDPTSLLDVCEPCSYSLIVDKSTSDSIACSEDVVVPLPYHITTSPNTAVNADMTESPEPLHPLHVLAVHIALLTKPKARWISLSYSMDRYPFLHLPLPETVQTDLEAEAMEVPATVRTSASTTTLPPMLQDSTTQKSEEEEDSDGYISLDDDLDDIPQKVIDNGFPDPSRLWTLVGKHDIEVAHPENGNDGHTTTHRPKVMHWVYILERTDVKLFITKPS